VLGHRAVGTSLFHIGQLTEARAHLDLAVALYDPVAHRSLATRFGQDVRMATLIRRSMVLWSLGYPEASLADANQALSDAREIDQVTTLFMALMGASIAYFRCGHYGSALEYSAKLIALADEKGGSFWKAQGMSSEGCVLSALGKHSQALALMNNALSMSRATGAKIHVPGLLSDIARANAENGRFDEAWRCIAEAQVMIEETKERWIEAEIHCTAGEILLKSQARDETKAMSYFERALAIAQKQQAKSWELRAATSMARLWRDQGKRDEARELLAPVYGWFTEGFDTLDLKEAKALLDELTA
jgi:predicted ATPase